MLVAEAMNSNPVTLPPTATARQAAQAMRDNDIGDVLVVDRQGRLQGIVTDRDIAVRGVAEGKTSAKLKDVSTPEPICIGPMEPLEDAAEVMRRNAIRRLPVVDGDDGKVMGVVSLGDLAIKLDDRSALAEISKAPPND